MNTYEIKLKDGTKIENLELNGNNFISGKNLEDSLFSEKNLSEVEISDGIVTTRYTDMVLVNIRIENGKTWFILREKTEQEKTLEKINKLMRSNADSITDLQLAIAEVYEIASEVFG